MREELLKEAMFIEKASNESLRVQANTLKCQERALKHEQDAAGAFKKDEELQQKLQTEYKRMQEEG